MIETIRPGMSGLAANYDGFIVDLWGVVHDGVHSYPGVIDCLTHLRAAGKPVVFLSNAPRRAAAIARALGAMGIDSSLYTGIMTSGEAVYDALKSRSAADFAVLGRRFIHLGPPRDRNIFADLDLTEVEKPEEAEFLINTGPDDLTEPDDPAAYDALLTQCLAVNLPMICANPDLEVIRGGRRIICAGALAARYAEWGGQVILRGKPDPAIYPPVLEMLGTTAARALAVGDSLRTDLAGAKAAGIDGVFVLSGIHQFTETEARAEAAAIGLNPVAILPGFMWNA
jgi:HAD superfamily hydrolase (TIGR01459 family)